MSKDDQTAREAQGSPADRRAPADDPPPDLVAGWAAEWPALVGRGARWTALSGGQTNAVWRVDSGAAIYVVKLYRRAGSTPLFANDPDAEAASLGALAGTGLAPALVAQAETPAGRSLVYTHVPGRPWQTGDDPALVAAALARLHEYAVPDGLPRAPSGPAWLRAQTKDLLSETGAAREALTSLDPGNTRMPESVGEVFVHGDATAANALVDGASLTFIDWQCPARGDAADDLAVFLSPAMQAVSGNADLTHAQEAAFLAAYAQARGAAGAAVVERYRALAPLYHWRMAAYASWRAARGDSEYADAAGREIARLRAATAG